MSVAVVVSGRTIREVARSIRRSPSEARTILEELRDAGIAVEVDEGVWALSERGEAGYVAAFRALPSWLEAGFA
jgi:hypothetical protein